MLPVWLQRIGVFLTFPPVRWPNRVAEGGGRRVNVVDRASKLTQALTDWHHVSSITTG